MIEGKTAKLITMIERLLSFSKMCSIEPEYETLDMNELVSDIFDECKSAEPERNITLIEGSLPQISGDDVLVRMLVKNLMTNAFKFTRHRQNAVITVSAIPDESYGVISFRDNGTGFDMAYADKLFGVFQRLHLDEEYEGSGIGLATADRIIKRHGGRIEAYGEVDNGAEFTLYFPK
jgi:light-regulated signal transduction histidine kinase (bacteriophytochrome)